MTNSIKWSKKPESFFGICFAFLVSTWNFQCCEKKYEPHRSSISEVIDSEICAYLNASEDFFRKTVWQWMCELVQKTPQICRKILLSNFSLFLARLSLKKLFLIRSQILGLLGNTLSVNYEYSGSNREKLPLPIHIKLSKKA